MNVSVVYIWYQPSGELVYWLYTWKWSHSGGEIGNLLGTRRGKVEGQQLSTVLKRYLCSEAPLSGRHRGCLSISSTPDFWWLNGRTLASPSWSVELPCGGWEWRDRLQTAELLYSLGPGTTGCSTLGVTCHVGYPLYGSLQQQGIDGLLEVLTAVSGPEADALMGELRSLLECTAYPVLDNAGGPAVAQQTPLVRGKVCQASPHLGPVNVVWLRKPQKTCQTSCGCRNRVSGGLPCRHQHERAAPVSLFFGSWWQ